MVVASIYWLEGPGFEYCRDFVIVNSGEILEVDIPPKIDFSCHFQVEHKLEIKIL